MGPQTPEIPEMPYRSTETHPGGDRSIGFRDESCGAVQHSYRLWAIHSIADYLVTRLFLHPELGEVYRVEIGNFSPELYCRNSRLLAKRESSQLHFVPSFR